MNKTVLITGVRGFLGRILAEELSTSATIVGLGRSGTDLSCDLGEAVPNIETTADIVVHCAGKAHSIPKNDQESEEFFQVNYRGTQNLCVGLENAEKLPELFVLISSVSVYGVDHGHNIPESAPLEGKTPYAKSKIQAEDHVKSWCRQHGVSFLILRLPLIVGQNPPGNLGKMITAIKKGRFLHIKGGRARKSMVVAKDIAKVIMSNSSSSGIYNLTDGYHPSFKELEEIIAESTHSKKAINVPFFIARCLAFMGDVARFFPFNSLTLQKMTLDLTFDDSLAQEKLGWQPTNVKKVLRQLNY